MDYRPDFLIIPGRLIWDKSLPEKAKILYGVIYWLHSLAMGKCVASNETLASFIDDETTPNYVSKLLKHLEDSGYIKREFFDSEKLERSTIIPLISYAVAEEGGTPQRRRGVRDSGVHISNINKEDILVKELYTLSTKYGKTPLSRLKSFYSLLFREQFGVEPMVYLNGKEGGALKLLLKSYSEVQIACLMIVQFNWYGATGQDDREFENLKKAGFPITWLRPNLNKYLIFLESIHKLKIDDKQAAEKFTQDYVRQLSTP